jgi:5,6-dimethylbenzimidazole synthase
LDAAFQAAFAELIVWRRDVGHFRTDEAPDEAMLAELFDLAALAPSVGNSQPPRFVRVDDGGAPRSDSRQFRGGQLQGAQLLPRRTRRLYARLKLGGLRDAPIHMAVFSTKQPNRATTSAR